MKPRPILVLQMQRMGDLILSFPLFLWLSKKYPKHPIWVVAEQMFFKELMPISPKVVYFPWTKAGLNRLRTQKFHLVLNLSHRNEAAELASQLKSEQKIGPVLEPDSARYIHGKLQLYRASITLSNRHNRFHWADLNALDEIPLQRIKNTRFPNPRTLDPSQNRIGLFIGASQDVKRPGVWFWSSMAAELLKRDLRPVLLGGPGEIKLGKQVAKAVPQKILNLCGKLKLSEFASVGNTLQLMITPDTGPMHLAAWTGLKVLCLSMGPINSWETGPYPPGHFVLRSNASCVGCWTCTQPEPICRRGFAPRRIGLVVQRIIQEKTKDLQKINLPGLELYVSARENGLYALKQIHGPTPETARNMLGQAWHAFWSEHFNLAKPESAKPAFEALSQEYPRLSASIAKSLPAFSRDLKQALAKSQQPLDPEFWSKGPPCLRPARSFCQMYLENNDFSPASWRYCLALLEDLSGLVG
ncbi:MAG: glycosyltransferase family 9 protein [Thermodesulfobacteriota bacterium]|nr:glycosyltransferase family 9 protein [Thermodesulfobacteriota bacterium]